MTALYEYMMAKRMDRKRPYPEELEYVEALQ